MREIKFRAWDKRSKKMREVISLSFNSSLTFPNDGLLNHVSMAGYDVIEKKLNYGMYTDERTYNQ